ncbi:hypothetical protein BU26DRAFT_609533, partial [Trematosphaeria pertusa]
MATFLTAAVAVVLAQVAIDVAPTAPMLSAGLWATAVGIVATPHYLLAANQWNQQPATDYAASVAEPPPQVAAQQQAGSTSRHVATVVYKYWTKAADAILTPAGTCPQAATQQQASSTSRRVATVVYKYWTKAADAILTPAGTCSHVASNSDPASSSTSTFAAMVQAPMTASSPVTTPEAGPTTPKLGYTLKTQLGAFWNAIADFASTCFSYMYARLVGFWSFITDFASGFFGHVYDLLNFTWTLLSKLLADFFNFAYAKLVLLRNILSNPIASVFSPMYAQLASSWSFLTTSAASTFHCDSYPCGDAADVAIRALVLSTIIILNIRMFPVPKPRFAKLVSLLCLVPIILPIVDHLHCPADVGIAVFVFVAVYGTHRLFLSFVFLEAAGRWVTDMTVRVGQASGQWLFQAWDMAHHWVARVAVALITLLIPGVLRWFSPDSYTIALKENTTNVFRVCRKAASNSFSSVSRTAMEVAPTGEYNWLVRGAAMVGPIVVIVYPGLVWIHRLPLAGVRYLAYSTLATSTIGFAFLWHEYFGFQTRDAALLLLGIVVSGLINGIWNPFARWIVRCFLRAGAAIADFARCVGRVIRRAGATGLDLMHWIRDCVEQALAAMTDFSQHLQALIQYYDNFTVATWGMLWNLIRPTLLVLLNHVGDSIRNVDRGIWSCVTLAAVALSFIDNELRGHLDWCPLLAWRWLWRAPIIATSVAIPMLTIIAVVKSRGQQRVKLLCVLLGSVAVEGGVAYWCPYVHCAVECIQDAHIIIATSTMLLLLGLWGKLGFLNASTAASDDDSPDAGGASVEEKEPAKTVRETKTPQGDAASQPNGAVEKQKHAKKEETPLERQTGAHIEDMLDTKADGRPDAGPAAVGQKQSMIKSQPDQNAPSQPDEPVDKTEPEENAADQPDETNDSKERPGTETQSDEKVGRETDTKAETADDNIASLPDEPVEHQQCANEEQKLATTETHPEANTTDQSSKAVEKQAQVNKKETPLEQQTKAHIRDMMGPEADIEKAIKKDQHPDGDELKLVQDQRAHNGDVLDDMQSTRSKAKKVMNKHKEKAEKKRAEEQEARNFTSDLASRKARVAGRKLRGDPNAAMWAGLGTGEPQKHSEPDADSLANRIGIGAGEKSPQGPAPEKPRNEDSGEAHATEKEQHISTRPLPGREQGQALWKAFAHGMDAGKGAGAESAAGDESILKGDELKSSQDPAPEKPGDEESGDPQTAMRSDIPRRLLRSREEVQAQWAGIMRDVASPKPSASQESQDGVQDEERPSSTQQPASLLPLPGREQFKKGWEQFMKDKAGPEASESRESQGGAQEEKRSSSTEQPAPQTIGEGGSTDFPNPSDTKRSPEQPTGAKMALGGAGDPEDSDSKSDKDEDKKGDKDAKGKAPQSPEPKKPSEDKDVKVQKSSDEKASNDAVSSSMPVDSSPKSGETCNEEIGIPSGKSDSSEQPRLDSSPEPKSTPKPETPPKSETPTKSATPAEQQTAPTSEPKPDVAPAPRSPKPWERPKFNADDFPLPVKPTEAQLAKGPNSAKARRERLLGGESLLTRLRKEKEADEEKKKKENADSSGAGDDPNASSSSGTASGPSQPLTGSVDGKALAEERDKREREKQRQE